MTMVTIAVTTDALWGEFMWIDHRNHPGGPLGYFGATTSMWMNVFGSAADATANILGDGLLVGHFIRSLKFETFSYSKCSSSIGVI